MTARRLVAYVIVLVAACGGGSDGPDESEPNGPAHPGLDVRSRLGVPVVSPISVAPTGDFAIFGGNLVVFGNVSATGQTIAGSVDVQQPISVALTRDGTRALVVPAACNCVQVFDTRRRQQVALVTVQRRLGRVLFTRGDARLFAFTTRGLAYELDPETYAIVDSMETGLSTSKELLVDTLTNLVYGIAIVADQPANERISAWDPATRTVVRSYVTSSFRQRLALSRDGSRLYYDLGRDVVAVDTRTGQVSATYSVLLPGETPDFDELTEIAVTPDDTRLWVVRNQQIAEVELATGALSFAVVRGAAYLAFAADGRVGVVGAVPGPWGDGALHFLR